VLVAGGVVAVSVSASPPALKGFETSTGVTTGISTTCQRLTARSEGV